MASNIVPKKYQKIVSVVFYTAVGLTGLVLLGANTIAILAAAGLTQFPAGFTAAECFFLLSISVTFMSVLLWFGMVLDVFRPEEKFRTMVSRVFIAGVLGAVLISVKKALIN